MKHGAVSPPPKQQVLHKGPQGVLNVNTVPVRVQVPLYFTWSLPEVSEGRYLRIARYRWGLGFALRYAGGPRNGENHGPFGAFGALGILILRTGFFLFFSCPMDPLVPLGIIYCFFLTQKCSNFHRFLRSPTPVLRTTTRRPRAWREIGVCRGRGGG